MYSYLKALLKRQNYPLLLHYFCANYHSCSSCSCPTNEERKECGVSIKLVTGILDYVLFARPMSQSALVGKCPLRARLDVRNAAKLILGSGEKGEDNFLCPHLRRNSQSKGVKTV